MPYKNIEDYNQWNRTHRKESRAQWKLRNKEAQEEFLATGKVRCTKLCKRCGHVLPLNAVYVICSECNVKYTVVPGYVGRDSYGVRLKVATA